MMPASPTASRRPMCQTVVSRLKKRPQFLRASAKGRKAATPGLVLQAFRRDDGVADTRVGFTVTKKVGNAVIRNRARRRLREAARLVLRDASGPVAHLAAMDLVLIGREGTLRRPFHALRRDLVSALERTGAVPPAPDERPDARPDDPLRRRPVDRGVAPRGRVSS